MKKAIARTDNITHEEWLRLRQQGIGGSDAAVACGMSRWKSPLMLFLEKTSGQPMEIDNEYIYWGNVMEPVLREEFAKRSGLKTKVCPFMFQCAEYPWMLANIDGVVHEKDGSTSLLEIKTANGYAAKDWEDGLPAEYYIQVQHYLAVCALNKAYVACLLGGNHFIILPVERDADTIATITALEADFWNNYVAKGCRPPVDDKAADALDQLYPQSDKTSTILTEEADKLISELQEIKKLEDQLTPEKSRLENKLKAMLGKSECGQTPAGYGVHWKSSSSSRFDTTRFKKEHPELATQYMSQSSYRRFSITSPKTKKEDK